MDGAHSRSDAPTAVPSRSGRLQRAFLQLVDSGIPPAIRGGDPDALRRARIIVSFTLVLILLGLEAVTFFDWALSEQASMRIEISLLVGLLLTLFVPLSLRRQGSLTLAANLVLTASYLVIFAAFTVVGGINAPLLHWCALLPMLAALMGSRGSAWIWTGVGFATLGGFAIADHLGWHSPDPLGVSALAGSKLWLQRFVDVGSWLGMLLAVALLYEGHKTQQTEQLALKNRELESEIAQRSRAEERTRYLAYYDELTTLPNRRLFQQQLASALDQAPRGDRMVGVLYLDLDHFKNVNDTHGHDLGDELLQQVAVRLRNCVRLSDCVARCGDAEPEVVSRLGGDEFTILLTGIRNHREAWLVAQRILQCLEDPFLIGDQEVHITTSIGIALHAGEVGDIDDLLRKADLAMYHAKARGKNGFQFFEESMNTDIVARSGIAADLRKALEQSQFELHFQPIVSPEFHRIVGVEALARWIHPDRGLVPAGEFIEIAEEYGLIVEIGDWAIREACRHHRKWAAQGIAPERVAVNVSGLQFRRGRVVATVLDALHESGMAPGSLELEITEGAMMVDEENASRGLAQLKQHGVRIALDDFGTGYSSLSYVKRFPVDSLKIDRSFVREIESSGEAQAIATAIVAMAHRLGLKVVGEGVETEAQERFLVLNECDELQGYRFGHPMPAEEMATRLAAQARRRPDWSI